jgi:hypothetical protein
MKSNTYNNNNPFPHIVIDNFFKTEFIDNIVKSVNDLKLRKATHKFLGKSLYEFNKITWDISKCDALLKDVFNELDSKIFIKILEDMTNVNNIVYTKEGGAKGSGIHKTLKNGYLGIHTDFNTFKDSKLGKLDRRINILVYLNPNWKEEYLGHLKLLEHGNKNNFQKILPILNRCVIFNTTKKSWHGHDEPLNCPDDIMRSSIANYYYTKNKEKGRDYEGEKEHSTRWWINCHKDLKGN